MSRGVYQAAKSLRSTYRYILLQNDQGHCQSPVMSVWISAAPVHDQDEDSGCETHARAIFSCRWRDVAHLLQVRPDDTFRRAIRDVHLLPVHLQPSAVSAVSDVAPSVPGTQAVQQRRRKACFSQRPERAVAEDAVAGVPAHVTAPPCRRHIARCSVCRPPTSTSCESSTATRTRRSLPVRLPSLNASGASAAYSRWKCASRVGWRMSRSGSGSSAAPAMQMMPWTVIACTWATMADTSLLSKSKQMHTCAYAGSQSAVQAWEDASGRPGSATCRVVFITQVCNSAPVAATRHAQHKPRNISHRR